MQATAPSVAPQPIVVLSIVWGEAPRLDRGVYEIDGFPVILGTAWVTYHGTAAMCTVAATYRGEDRDYLFLGGYEDDIRADLEWALSPFYPMTRADLDALVTAVINAVKAETEVVK
jgi:hypothetical protein